MISDIPGGICLTLGALGGCFHLSRIENQIFEVLTIVFFLVFDRSKLKKYAV